MSNGEALAQARHRAGLSVAQVSEQTRIRPLIIRSIEAGDYSLCGGDLRAREDIRSIAEVVGADPGPMIEMYDLVRRAPWPVPPASPDEPPGPPRPAWHGRSAFMLAFGVVATMLTISSVGYRFMQDPPPGPGAVAAAADKHTSLAHITVGYPGPDAAPAPGPAPARHPDPEQALSRAHSMAPVSAVAFGPDG
ncbi:MAG: helix-turn-helix domain-containing protein, partial [Streptosporangiaceae bacterium]